MQASNQLTGPHRCRWAQGSVLPDTEYSILYLEIPRYRNTIKYWVYLEIEIPRNTINGPGVCPARYWVYLEIEIPISPRYPPHIPPIPQDIPQISPKLPQDIPPILPRYPQDIPKKSSRSPQDAGLVWFKSFPGTKCCAHKQPSIPTNNHHNRLPEWQISQDKICPGTLCRGTGPQPTNQSEHQQICPFYRTPTPSLVHIFRNSQSCLFLN